MTDRVLSDAEIRDIAKSYRGTVSVGPMSTMQQADAAPFSYTPFDEIPFARAVEAAVLAKAREGFVPEPEARRRERGAWDAAHSWMWGRSPTLPSSVKGDAERDRRYPSLEPEPREVVGPSGRLYRRRPATTSPLFPIALQISNPSIGMGWSPMTKNDKIPIEDAATVAKLMEEAIGE